MSRTLITVSEAAAIRGMDARLIRYHVAQGHLTAVTVNPRLMLLDRAEVEAFRPNPAGRPKEKPAKKKRKSA